MRNICTEYLYMYEQIVRFIINFPIYKCLKIKVHWIAIDSIRIQLKKLSFQFANSHTIN